MRKRLSLFLLLLLCVVSFLSADIPTRRSGNWYSVRMRYGAYSSGNARLDSPEIDAVIEGSNEDDAISNMRIIMGKILHNQTADRALDLEYHVFAISLLQDCPTDRYWNQDSSPNAVYKDVYFYNTVKEELKQYVVKRFNNHELSPRQDLINGSWSSENRNNRWSRNVEELINPRPINCVPRQSESSSDNTSREPPAQEDSYVAPTVSEDVKAPVRVWANTGMNDSSYVSVNWQLPRHSTIHHLEIQKMWKYDRGRRTTAWRDLLITEPDDPRKYYSDCYAGRQYKFRARCVTSDNKASLWTESEGYTEVDFLEPITVTELIEDVNAIGIKFEFDDEHYRAYTVKFFDGDVESEFYSKVPFRSSNSADNTVTVRSSGLRYSHTYKIVVEGNGKYPHPDNRITKVVHTKAPVIEKRIKEITASRVELEIVEKEYFTGLFNVTCKPYLSNGSISSDRSSYIIKDVENFDKAVLEGIDYNKKYRVTLQCQMRGDDRVPQTSFDYRVSARTRLMVQNPPGVTKPEVAVKPVTIDTGKPTLPLGKAKTPEIRQPQYKVLVKVTFKNNTTRKYYKTVTAPNTRIAGDTAKKQVIKSLGSTAIKKIVVVKTTMVSSTTKNTTKKKTTGTSTLKKK